MGRGIRSAGATNAAGATDAPPTALVTGGSDGVGLEIARSLAADGMRVILPVRNRKKGQRAIARIRETVPDAHIVLRDLDLARMDSVATLAYELNREGTPIQRYVLNAGVVTLGERERRTTADGFELHFATNFLGHAALTRGILSLLRAGNARVAVQCSLAAAWVRPRWDDLQFESGYRPLRAYAASKLALGLFGMELARRTAGSGMSVNLCHPGIAPGTAIAPVVREALPAGVVRWATAHVGNAPAEAAMPLLAALGSDVTARPDPGGAPTVMFAPRGPFQLAGAPRRRRVWRALRDPVAASRVWNLAAALAGSVAVE